MLACAWFCLLFLLQSAVLFSLLSLMLLFFGCFSNHQLFSQHRTEIESILALPKVISIMPPYQHEEEWMKQVATDCIWSDPASEDMERTYFYRVCYLYALLLWFWRVRCIIHENVSR
jgi:hypothetical protein